MARWDLVGVLDSAFDLGAHGLDPVNEVYCASDRANVQFKFLDVSDPTNPVLAGTLDVSGTGRDPLFIVPDPSRQLAITVSSTGDSDSNTMDLVDYADPANPVILDTDTRKRWWSISHLVDEGEGRVWVNHIKTLGSSQEGLSLVAYSRANGFTNVPGFDNAPGFPRGQPILDRENWLVLMNYLDNSISENVLHLLDVGTTVSSTPTLLDTLNLPDNGPWRNARPDPSRRVWFAANNDADTLVAVQWDGSSLSEVGRLDLGAAGVTGPFGMAITGNGELLFIGSQSAGTYQRTLVDVSDETNLSIISQQTDWPNSTRTISAVRHIGLYKNESRATLLAQGDDYFAVFETDHSANAPPDKPTCSVDSVDQREADLSSSAFSDPDGDPHDSSRWQVRDQGDADWSSPEHDSGWTTTDLTTHTTDRDLSPGANYEARVAHRDPDGAFTWSDPVSFTTETLDEVQTIGPEGFFFGPDGRNDLLEFGQVHEDAGAPVTGEMLHRAIAPQGAAGEALFRYLRVTITYETDFDLTLTPVLDGEKLSSEASTVSRSIGTAGQITETLEMELGRSYGNSRQGLRGTWIRTLIEVTETTGHAGYIAVDGVEYEWEPVRESKPALSFHQENLTPASLPTISRFMFGAGNEIGEFGPARDDLGNAVEALLHSNPIAPAGPGGECIFTNLYLALTRANPSDVPLNVAAIVDEERHAVATRTLTGISTPKLEVLEVPLTKPYAPSGVELSRQRLRGSWLEIELDTDGSLPDGDIVFETAEVAYEVVQESEADLGG